MRSWLKATSLGHISLSENTMSGITNALVTTSFFSKQQTCKILSNNFDFIIASYSSKKMGILNEHFPACILAFVRKRCNGIRLELLYAKFG